MAGKISGRRLGDLCLLCSALILEGVALFGVRSVLAAHQLEGQFNLVGETRLELPLPSDHLQLVLPTQTPEAASSAASQAVPTATPPPILPTSEPPTIQNPSPVAGLAGIPTAIPASPTPYLPSPTPAPTATPETLNLETEAPALPTPAPVSSTGRIVRLLIPRLGVDRVVVPLGFTQDSKGTMDWATDKLFATANRKDLVGQTITSVDPGEGGNIVLMGHNYDNGYYAWEDAFVNIKTLTPGDQIIVYTEGGGEYHYTVQLVKKIPWIKENAAEAAKHYKYLGPTPGEQLTLVTCGGANVWPWQARIYVVAVPAP